MYIYIIGICASICAGINVKSTSTAITVAGICVGMANVITQGDVQSIDITV